MRTGTSAHPHSALPRSPSRAPPLARTCVSARGERHYPAVLCPGNAGMRDERPGRSRRRGGERSESATGCPVMKRLGWLIGSVALVTLTFWAYLGPAAGEGAEAGTRVGPADAFNPVTAGEALRMVSVNCSLATPSLRSTTLRSFRRMRCRGRRRHRSSGCRPMMKRRPTR